MLNLKQTTITIHALIINKNEEMLIVKRADHDSRPGVWEMPGGTLEFGENPEKGIIREVKEETGLDIKIVHPITISSSAIDGFIKNHKIRISFLGKKLTDDQSVNLSHEHSEYKWVKPTEKIDNISSFLVKTLEVYLQDAALAI